MSRHQRPLLLPCRVRIIEHPFGWMPCRILTNGTIESMSQHERQLLLFLSLASDSRGISFYGDTRITQTLGFTWDELIRARNALVARDLLAFDGKTYQLLSLPKAVQNADHSQVHNHQRAINTSHTTKVDSMAPPLTPSQGMPECAREALRKLFGPNSF